ncbi:zinc carboxypeptidase [Gregarina niphandrodes]|uniref:Zinc carboxypeptidase n=1 Tax=Gregarina niphandrodes TaxID=110365 RepID=A0A023B8A8_GRENI|nr:zinc carboxypeptidase [Gregarina niphandrodes]EZG68470.1 zinc carboxypeptidase [Gregarina niphandrodes]|eukprot:XP_011134575.1 zinc carboxypeptidase [Gregarina niphandrodes]
MKALGLRALALLGVGEGRLYSALNYNESMSMLRQLELGGDVLTLEDVSPLAQSRSQCFIQHLCSINPLVKLTASKNSPAVLFSGTVHGDERLGSAITLYLAEYLTQEYRKNNTYVQWLLARREVHLLPFANLDGFVFNHRHDYQTEKAMQPSRDRRQEADRRQEDDRRQEADQEADHKWKSSPKSLRLPPKNLSQPWRDLSQPLAVAVEPRATSPQQAPFFGGKALGTEGSQGGFIQRLDALRKGKKRLGNGESERKRDAPRVRVDPNRDFPYLNPGCPKSVSGQILYQVIMSKLYVAGITFHGGMRSLTYNWGGPNHLDRLKKRSTESPDDAMQRFIAKELQEAAGIIPLSDIRHRDSELLSLLQAKDATQRVPTDVLMAYKPHLFSVDPNPNYAYFYPIAPTNDLVYPVNGSVEDWAYGGGWEDSMARSGGEIISCKQQGYDKHLRFPFFLVETDDDKAPQPQTYGDRVDVNYLTAYSGHIPRNIRMCLRLIEMVEPEVAMSYNIINLGRTNSPTKEMRINSPVIGNGDIQDLLKALRQDLNNSFEIITAGEEQENTLLFLNLYFTGCQSVRNINVYVGIDLLYRDNNHYLNLCSSFGGLKMTNFQRYNVILHLPPSVSGPVLVSAEFDKEWGQQMNPDPAEVMPQSHLVKIRLQPDYEVAGSGGDSISSNVTQFYPRIVFKKSKCKLHRFRSLNITDRQLH